MEKRKKFGWKEYSPGLRIFTVGLVVLEVLSFAPFVSYPKNLQYQTSLFLVLPLIVILSFWSRRDYTNWAKRQGYEDTRPPRIRASIMILVLAVLIVAFLLGVLFGLGLI